mmetsp:Transcript_45608/g.145535  ORF Transcript_45608/g.145535 Transcript_45608/m.145535 type:complete len:291 (+) Transcript_45608:369-1241(+)
MTKMPCSSPRLHSSNTDSASLPYAVRLGWRLGSSFSPVDSLAVRRNRAADFTQSSVAFWAKESETTSPRPISPQSPATSSRRTRALLQRCTTTATPAGNGGKGTELCAEGTPGCGLAGSWDCGPLAPSRGACGRCSAAGCSRAFGWPGSTSSARFLNSSTIEGGRSPTSTSGSSTNFLIQLSLSIKIRSTSVQRSCRKGRSLQSLQMKRQADSLSSSWSNTSLSFCRWMQANRNFLKRPSHSFSQRAGGDPRSSLALSRAAAKRARRSSAGTIIAARGREVTGPFLLGLS